MSLTSTGMSIAFAAAAGFEAAGVPLIGLATGGNWSGSLRYASPTPDNQGGWTGDIHLQDTDVPFEAFAQPIHVVRVPMPRWTRRALF